MAASPQARSRALMLATLLGLAAYVAPLPFSPFAVLTVFFLLLPPLAAFVALEVGLPLRRATGLPLVVAVLAPPLVVGIAAGLATAAVAGEGQSTMVLWAIWTASMSGVGAWLILRKEANL